MNYLRRVRGSPRMNGMDAVLISYDVNANDDNCQFVLRCNKAQQKLTFGQYLLHCHVMLGVLHPNIIAIIVHCCLLTSIVAWSLCRIVNGCLQLAASELAAFAVSEIKY